MINHGLSLEQSDPQENCNVLPTFTDTVVRKDAWALYAKTVAVGIEETSRTRVKSLRYGVDILKEGETHYCPHLEVISESVAIRRFETKSELGRKDFPLHLSKASKAEAHGFPPCNLRPAFPAPSYLKKAERAAHWPPPLPQYCLLTFLSSVRSHCFCLA